MGPRTTIAMQTKIYTKICQNVIYRVQIVYGTCLDLVQSLTRTGLELVWILSRTCLELVQNLSRTCLELVQNLSRTCHQHLSRIQKLFRYSLDTVQKLSRYCVDIVSRLSGQCLTIIVRLSTRFVLEHLLGTARVVTINVHEANFQYNIQSLVRLLHYSRSTLESNLQSGFCKSSEQAM